MAQFRDVVDPIREATIGYRAQLIADGFSLESADSMAADFHRMVVTKVTSDLLARAKK